MDGQALADGFRSRALAAVDEEMKLPGCGDAVWRGGGDFLPTNITH